MSIILRRLLASHLRQPPPVLQIAVQQHRHAFLAQRRRDGQSGLLGRLLAALTQRVHRNMINNAYPGVAGRVLAKVDRSEGPAADLDRSRSNRRRGPPAYREARAVVLLISELSDQAGATRGGLRCSVGQSIQQAGVVDGPEAVYCMKKS